MSGLRKFDGMLKAAAIRAYKSQKDVEFLSDYSLFALLGYYFVNRPGAEVESLREDMAREYLSEAMGNTALRVLNKSV